MGKVMVTGNRWIFISLIAIIMALFTGESYAMVKAEDVVAMWLFNDDAEDASGNGNDGEIKGSLKFVEGVFGKALYFPKQSGSFVLVPHNDAFHLDSFSLAVWAKMENPGERQVIVSNRKQGETTRTFQIKIETGQAAPEFNFTSGKDWQGTDNVRAVTDMTDGEWHHIAATYDGKNMRIYVDGVLERESVRDEEPDQPGSPLAIGGQFEAGSYPFSGVLDELAILKVVLDQEDIENIRDKGLEEVVGLVAVYYAGKLAASWARVKSSGLY